MKLVYYCSPSWSVTDKNCMHPLKCKLERKRGRGEEVRELLHDANTTTTDITLLSSKVLFYTQFSLFVSLKSQKPNRQVSHSDQ